MRKKYRVDISSRAEQDILAFATHIARDKPGAAAKWARRMASRIRSLASFPERFAIIPEPIESDVPFRHHVFGNYRIIYRVETERVLVVRVVHAAQLLGRRAFDLGSPQNPADGADHT